MSSYNLLLAAQALTLVGFVFQRMAYNESRKECELLQKLLSLNQNMLTKVLEVSKAERKNNANT